MEILPDICYCLAARNEERNIGDCLRSLASQIPARRCATLVCVNGCTDGTVREVQRIQECNNRLNIELIESQPGLGFAYNALVERVQSRGFDGIPVLFIDADVTLNQTTVAALVDEVERNPTVQVVGAWPVPRRPPAPSVWQSLLYRILHVRALHPLSEVSKYCVREYKRYVKTIPQSAVPPDAEKRLRIYFHGRCYLLRHAGIFALPAGSEVGDDTYISNHVHLKYGPGSIRTRYDAVVEYHPFTSLRTHYRAYKRYWSDLRNIDRNYPQFSRTRKLEQTRIDYGYVLRQPPWVVLQFLAYGLAIHLERALFALRPGESFSEIIRTQKDRLRISSPDNERKSSMFMFVVMTQRCNLSCQHCYLPSVPFQPGVPDDLVREDFMASMHQIANSSDQEISEICLTGGEPLLLSYGDEAVNLTRQAFPKARILVYTNGLPFVAEPTLFERVRPDVFHIGLDAWHGGMHDDGQSPIADLFVSKVDFNQTRLIFHWTRKDGDDELFESFFHRYAHLNGVDVEDRGLNTTTGRAAGLDRPSYRENEFWRPCSLGDHVLLKFDGQVYGCQFAVPWSAIGEGPKVHVGKKLHELRESPIGRVLRSEEAEAFYRETCERHGIEFTPYSCILCEELTYNGVDIPEEARRWLNKPA